MPTKKESGPKPVDVFTRYNENESTYELVAMTEGVPVVYATVKGGAVESAKGQAEAAESQD